MTSVRVTNFSISLDGYGAGPDQSQDDPIGVGGLRLHEWHLQADEPGREADVEVRDELLKPSVTKWNVVPPSISIGSRGWCVRTKTGAWYGGSSPHHPRQSPVHSPRIGPNMLRPMT